MNIEKIRLAMWSHSISFNKHIELCIFLPYFEMLCMVMAKVRCSTSGIQMHRNLDLSFEAVDSGEMNAIESFNL